MTQNQFFFNGQQLGDRVENFDEAKLEAFIAEFGQEQAVGYVKAFQDISNGLDRVYEWFNGDMARGPKNPNQVRKGLKNFIEHNKEILDICKTVLERHSMGSANQPK